MVLKSTKNGVYSGNTLRASNSRYNRLYRTHGCIVRRFVRHVDNRVTRIKSLIDNFDIAAYDVEFSLNKKERWGLLDAIRKHIQDGETPDEVTKTDLVVRHKLKRQANCVAYYANKGLLKRLVPKCGRYFDGKSATEFKIRPKKKTNRRTEPADNEQTTEVIPTDTVRYEVFLPCSRFSSLVHNPKYVKPELDEDESTSFGNGRKKKKRTRLTSRDIDEILEFSDPRNDNIQECDTPSEDSDTADTFPRQQFTLRDFIKPERKPKRKAQRRLSRESEDPECKKKGVVYVEEQSKEKDTDVSNESTNSDDVQSTTPNLTLPTTLIPIVVKLTHDETAFDSLQTAYGVRYIEAWCEPRKFSIDITEKVREHVRYSKLFRNITPSSLDLTCYLNFTEQGPCPNEAKYCVYKVSLNLASNMNSIKLENVLEMETYSINELEAKVMSYVDMLPRDVFVKSEIPNSLGEPVMKFNLVNKAMKWRVNCIHPEEYLQNAAYVSEMNPEAVKCEFPSEFCNICYDEIQTDFNESDMQAPATCLSACGPVTNVGESTL